VLQYKPKKDSYYKEEKKSDYYEAPKKSYYGEEKHEEVRALGAGGRLAGSNTPAFAGSCCLVS
jgi:hypothetical protein